MTFKFTSKSILVFVLSSILVVQVSFANQLDNQLIRLATTTSTDNSGLLKYLLPQFEKETSYKVSVIAVGTGKALQMGKDGDVDVLLVHALNAEQKFVADGHGTKRFPVMYNDFVIVGPKVDIRSLSATETVIEAFKQIAHEKKTFISRGDDSGTHKKEISLWKETDSIPNGKFNRWYLEAGQGMGKVLQMAGEIDAYTMTDRGTWLALENKLPLAIAFEGDAKLFNPYGIIAISEKKYPNVNKGGAMALINWLTSEKGQHLIGKFKVSGKVLFTPSAASIATK